MLKKYKGFVVLVLGVLLITLCGCEYTKDRSNKWRTKFDINLPNVASAGSSPEAPNGDGWYSTLLTDFEDNTLGDIWQPINNCLRKEEYWCDKMVSQADGKVTISAREIADHKCDNCGDASNLYTSGIATFKFVDNKRVPTFEQAFGYFEARVKLPNSGGMWSAFWLNSLGMGDVGNGGEDGAEIDIYESAFFKNKSMVGNCIHYDGYGKHHKAGEATHDVGYDLYEGYHTFSLKWTPNEYVFFVDGVAVWATNFGGVSKVAGYLLLTNEVRPNSKRGPYGQRLGDFTGGDFVIEYVNVYQNINYLPHIVARK
ncbi:MAG: glycoside hydrolase family 16 protein [Clostridia bacterium]